MLITSQIVSLKTIGDVWCLEIVISVVKHSVRDSTIKSVFSNFDILLFSACTTLYNPIKPDMSKAKKSGHRRHKK